jgi:MFS family permease
MSQTSMSQTSMSQASMTADVRRVVRLSYGFQFFFGLLWWLPIFYEFQRGIGLSDGEIFGIQSIYYIAFCLFEIPTGMFADRFDYRRCLLAGAAVLTIANLFPIGLASYTGFLLHFLLIALARSLVSGAASAYLYEYLHRSGAGEAYRQSEGRGRAYSLIGRVVCWPLVGLLMQWQLPSPYWLSALSTAVAAIVAVKMPPLPAGPDRSRTPLWTTLGNAVGILRRSRVLLLIMVQGVAIFTLVRICQVNLFQPILGAKDVPVTTYGIVLAAMTVFEAAGAARVGWLTRWVSDLRAVFVLTAAMALSLALVVPMGAAGTVVLLCVFALASGLSFPVQRQLLNTAIPDSRYRATLLSAESIIDRAVCALVALALGAYLARGELNEFLVTSAALTAVLMAATAGLLVLARRRAATSDPVAAGAGTSGTYTTTGS